MGVWDILTWGCGVCRDPHLEHPHMGVWSNGILSPQIKKYFSYALFKYFVSILSAYK